MADGTYEVRPYEVTRVPGVPSFVVYHDGDEESTVKVTADGWVSFGPTSGRWQIDPRPPGLSSAIVTTEATRLEPGDDTDQCSYSECGKPVAWLPVEQNGTVGYQWRHVHPADEEAAGKPGFMHVGYPMPR